MADNSKQRQRVVVTGMGAITSQGNSLEAFWDGVSNGRVAIRDVKHMPMDGYRTKLGGRCRTRRRPSTAT